MPDGFDRQETTGETCANENVFTLSKQVNAFSSVSDYKHSLSKVEAKEAEYEESGNTEYYVCSECGRQFADENATVELTSDDVTIHAKSYTLLTAALFFVGFAVLATGVTVVAVFLKKRK